MKRKFMDEKQQTDKVVRLGVMPPLTGLVSLYGHEISWAAKIACDEINERGGVLGCKLELVVEDDGSMPGPAVVAAENLIDEHGCVAIIGNLLSNARIDVANRVAEPRRIPYLNFSFYEGSINSRYFFNFSALPNQQIEKMIPWMADEFGPKMFFAGNNYEWPRGSIDAAKRSLLSCGGEVVGEEYFDIGTDDFQDLIERIRKSGADVFVPYAAGNDQITLLNTFAESGLKKHMAVVMGHYDEVMVANLLPDVRNGMYSSNTYFMTIDSKANKQYLERLSRLPEVSAIWPQGNGVLTNFGEGTYVCVHAFALAAEMAGSFDSEQLVNALENVVIDAPQGIVAMDPETHHAKVNTWLSRCNRDGIFEIIKSFGQIPPKIPHRYRTMATTTQSQAQETSTNNSWQLIAVIPYPLKYTCPGEANTLSFTSSDIGEAVLDKLFQALEHDAALLNNLADCRKSGEIELGLDSSSLHVKLEPLYVEMICTQFAIHLKDVKGSINPVNVRSSIKPVKLNNEKQVAVMITDIKGVVTYVNQSLLELWNVVSADKMVGQHISEFFSMPGNGRLSFIDTIARNDSLYTARYRDGSVFKLDVAVDPVKSRNDNQVGFILSCYGRPENNLDNPTPAMINNHILKAVDVAIVAIDEKLKIIQTNESACTMFGYKRNEMHNMSLNQLLPPHLRNAHDAWVKEFFASPELSRRMGDGDKVTGYKSDGTFFPLEASITKFKTDDEWIMVATIRDITEFLKVEEDLVRSATHDSLTNLPNRMLINDRIASALGRSERTGKSVALMFVDLDEFKLVNDTYGHDVGDQLLIAISNELVKVVRPGDTVARFGGDEFIVMCDQLTDWDIVTKLAERIVDRLKHPQEIAGHEFYATVSIGVAIGHGLTHNAEELLRNADAAMYQAKERGRDGWMIFSDEMSENSRLQLKIATGLRNAAKNNELHTMLQPIVNSTTGEIIGAETLLRWTKDQEVISPGVFIPIAEMTGSILSIGEWVFRRACVIQYDWAQTFRGQTVPYITVNLSARQLNEPDLVEKFSVIMRETQADPNMMVLEITESTLMKDVEHTIRILNELGELGLSLAVDDFGTGYSSLSHLKRLPVDTLKVDRIFVDGIDHHDDTRSITAAIINMAHSLDLNVTAEGVETMEQMDMLREMGCDTIQGYYFYKPMPVPDLKQLLIQQTTLKAHIH